MKLLRISLLTLAALPSALPAQSTPLTDPVVEEKETLITCEVAKAPPRTGIPVFGSVKDCETAVGTYHYKLWVPKGYLSDPAKRYPCIFIMSPGGNAGLGNMGAYLKENGFVAVMLVEAKNGAWGPIVGNFLAAHDDVTKRLRIQEGQKYATGQSGGARASSVFVQARPGFCGLILQAAGASYGEGARYNVSGIKSNPKLYTAMIMGDTDSNKKEVPLMKAALGSSRFESFEFTGGHAWAPADKFAEAMAWVRGKTTGPSAAFGR